MSEKEARSAYAADRKLLKTNWNLLDAPFVSDQAAGEPAPLQEDPPEAASSVVALPSAEGLQPVGGSLLELLRGRRSRRKHDPAKSLSAEELSFLCWAAAGIVTHKPKFSFRTVPSGGCRHPLDLYVYVSRVVGIPEGLYRYLPVEHALAAIRAGDSSADLDAALRGQLWKAAALFVWVAVPYRTEWRYGPAAHKLVAIDAGHSCENLYLSAEAIGAGTCVLGAYDQEALDRYLGLDGEDRFALCAAPVGKA